MENVDRKHLEEVAEKYIVYYEYNEYNRFMKCMKEICSQETESLEHIRKPNA